jgi:hypothetical protein
VDDEAESADAHVLSWGPGTAGFDDAAREAIN